MKVRQFGICCILGLILGGPAFSGEPAERAEKNRADATYPEGEVQMGLTLEDCIHKAYENNITIRKGFQGLDAASTFIPQARGAFDPVFYTNIIRSRTTSPSASILDAGIGVEKYDQANTGASFGFRGTLLSGATYTLSTNFNQTYDPDSQWLLFNPMVRSDAGLELRQPLLKGGWTVYTRAEINAAELGTQSEALILETSLNEVIFSVVEAYWNLVFAHEDLEVKRKTVELSDDLLAINMRKKEEGVFGKIEVLEARVDVAIRKEEVLTAENAVESAADRLKHLIFPFERPEDWDIQIVPLTEAQEAREDVYDLDAMVLTAQAKRPDYRRLKVDFKNRELDLLTARNALMPSLDLLGKWSYSSLGSNYGNSLNDIFNRKFNYYHVGFEFSYPLGNRSASSASRRAAINLQNAQTTLTELRVQIVHEIRDAVRDVNLQRERIQATLESFTLSKERYIGEKKRLEAGLSIPYQVREAERNLSNEAVAHTRAIVDYQVALAKIDQVQGVLLSKYHFFLPSSRIEQWTEARG